MPATSKEQKRLMAWAFACKNKKTNNCPDNVMKLANGMTNKQLKDFFESEELEEFLNQMYPIPEEGAPNAGGGTSISSLSSVPGMGRSAPPASMTSLGGSGSDNFVGSGDRWDNDIPPDEDEDEEGDKVKKKKKLELLKIRKKRLADKIKNDKNIQMGMNDKQPEGLNIPITFDEFVSENILLKEERFAGKRKYTPKHPEMSMNVGAPIRAKILEFLNSKKTASEKELKQFFQSLEEDLGKQPSWSWLSKNQHLVKKFENNGENHYKLTHRGEVVLDRIKSLK